MTERSSIHNATHDVQHIAERKAWKFWRLPLLYKKRIVEAVRTDDIQETRRLLSKGASVDTKDHSGETLLHTAILNRYFDLAEVLITCGADVGERDPRGRTPLHCAAFHDNPGIVGSLLRRGADIDAPASVGQWTPLHFAISLGNLATVTLLLDKGADTSLRNSAGFCPLHCALSEAFMRDTESGDTGGWHQPQDFRPQRLRIIELLVSSGLDINAVDSSGDTPLHLAVRFSWPEAAEYLVAHGASVHSTNSAGTPPYFEAAVAASSHVEAMMTIFTRQGINLNHQGPDGSTLLHMAAAVGNAELVAFLLSRGIAACERNNKGWTPLHCAASRGDTNIADLLLARGIDIDIEHNDGGTRLVIAAGNLHKDMVSFLLSRGANPDAHLILRMPDGAPSLSVDTIISISARGIGRIGDGEEIKAMLKAHLEKRAHGPEGHTLSRDNPVATPPQVAGPDPDVPISPRWYFATSDAKHVRQVVIVLPPEAHTPPSVSNLVADAGFMQAAWAATAVFVDGSTNQAKGPTVFAKASGVIELLKGQPPLVALSFYHLRDGGVFQLFVQTDSPQIREKRQNAPFLAEHARWLGSEHDRALVQALLAGSRLDLCFVGPGASGPCTGQFGLQVRLPREVKDVLTREWDELVTHHKRVVRRDFEAALAQYNLENPMEGTPILARSLSSRSAKGAMVSPTS